MNAVNEPIVESTVAAAATANGATPVSTQQRVVGYRSPELAAEPTRKRKRPIVLLVLLSLALIGGTIAAIYAVHASHFQSTDDAFIEGRTVTISPQISALVKVVRVDDNQQVRAGDVLVELDDTDYQVALEQAKATKGAMEGKLEQARSEINGAIASRDQASAEVEVATANSTNAVADYGRFTELSKKNPGAVSKQQMDAAVAAWQSSTAQVKQARAKQGNAEAEIATKTATANAAAADVRKAEADVHKAQVNLGYCTVRAVEAGKITRKNVEPGSYVQTGEQLFALVPSQVWVVANFKETQLEKMRMNQAVTISVDAYPDLQLHGHVQSIQAGTGSRFSMLPAENATGNFVKVVQRVPVKILIDEKNSDADHLLTPGMSVLPEVDVR